MIEMLSIYENYFLKKSLGGGEGIGQEDKRG